MTVTRQDGASNLNHIKQSKNRNQIVGTEILVVIGVVAVLFMIMLPNFLRAQSNRQIASVENTVNSIASMLATTPGVFAEIDRG
ncbi:hypothetical protein K8I31_19390 [bacterium]|nr:hypothetical protein [bacterium]